MGESELFWRADDQAQRLLELTSLEAGLRNTG